MKRKTAIAEKAFVIMDGPGKPATWYPAGVRYVGMYRAGVLYGCAPQTQQAGSLLDSSPSTQVPVQVTGSCGISSVPWQPRVVGHRRRSVMGEAFRADAAALSIVKCPVCRLPDGIISGMDGRFAAYHRPFYEQLHAERLTVPR
jgi:hypothetical protein